VTATRRLDQTPEDGERFSELPKEAVERLVESRLRVPERAQFLEENVFTHGTILNKELGTHGGSGPLIHELFAGAGSTG
jgi:hypothetical protein